MINFDLKKVIEYFNRCKLAIIIILLVLFLTVGGCALVKILNYKIPEPDFNQLPTAVAEENIIRRKIDGQELKSEIGVNLYPVAIMVENAADSWPASGLDKANLVFEAITEGSIPRFVAVFATDEEVKKIGPVRSARPYYLDWVEPLAPLYMHVGGAPEALQKIRSGRYDLIDFDQFFWDEYYWRDKWRYAPHNVYTSSALIQSALTKKELNQPVDYPTWKYKKDLALAERPEQVNDIKINFAAQFYKVRWEYNREDNDYIRYQNGDLHKMSDGAWIKAKNVIVQVNDMKVIDEIGRKKITTLGEGRAWIYRDGTKIEATWKKATISDGLKYFDRDGNEIDFNGGISWIESIPTADYLRD